MRREHLAYTAVSLVLFGVTLYNAFRQHQHFFPSMVYLWSSKVRLPRHSFFIRTFLKKKKKKKKKKPKQKTFAAFHSCDWQLWSLDS